MASNDKTGGARWAGSSSTVIHKGYPTASSIALGKADQMCRLDDSPTLDTMLRVFKLLVQNTDDVRLGLMRPNGEVGVR